MNTGVPNPRKNAWRPWRLTDGNTGAGIMRINQDFLEFIRLLNTHEVRYLIVGAYVRAFYGRPRYTGDMDIFFEATEENARNVCKALDDFGFGSLTINMDDLLTPDTTIQLGREPRRIDLITGITGVDFETAWKNHQVFKHPEMDIPFLGKEDYIANKKALGRHQDLADVEELFKD